MAVWGIDLGVRSFTAARLCGNEVRHYQYACPTPKSVKNAPAENRWQELRHLRVDFARMLSPDDEVFIEDPRFATGPGKNISTSLAMAEVLGALMAVSPCPAYKMLVSAWKKDTVGNGNADKALVARWLAARHPEWSRLCDGDQNRVDATCIALYGWGQGAAAARGLDPLRATVGVGL